QPLADGHAGDVHGLLRQSAGGEQLEHALAQQVDRADLAIERLADHLDHGVELCLRVHARRHHLVKAGKDHAGGGNGGWHESRLPETGALGNGWRRQRRPGTCRNVSDPVEKTVPGGEKPARAHQWCESSSLILSLRFLRTWIIDWSGAGRLSSSASCRSIPACFICKALTCDNSMSIPPELLLLRSYSRPSRARLVAAVGNTDSGTG